MESSKSREGLRSLESVRLREPRRPGGCGGPGGSSSSRLPASLLDNRFLSFA